MTNLRSQWGKAGCPVLVATAYKASWMSSLFGCSANAINHAIYDSEHYQLAKKQKDVKAAIEVCRHALDKAYRVRVKMEVDKLISKGYGEPILVAPCKPTSKNALAKTAAEFLGKKLKIEVDHSIQEKPCPSRREADRRDKFFQRPEFIGNVQKGRLYILVDDMVTTGATLAELRSYIVKNGGDVAFACSLASCDGMDKQLHLSNVSKTRVENMFKSLGKAVQDCIKNTVGITPDTLTEAEADFLSSGKGKFALEQYVQSVGPR